jgi:hypothetical protein
MFMRREVVMWISSTAGSGLCVVDVVVVELLLLQTHVEEHIFGPKLEEEEMAIIL